jgi:hypothetical protein
MTAVLLENIKLIMLFLLIGSIIGLSHIGQAATARPQFLRRYRRPVSATL